MRFFDSRASKRSLEWRVAAAWIFVVLSLLIQPGVSSREPYLLNHTKASHFCAFGASVIALVLTFWPIVRGEALLKTLASFAAVIAAYRIAAWIVLLFAEPQSWDFPLWG